MVVHQNSIPVFVYIYSLDTSGTTLYLPYCVLQELDKLKHYENQKVKLMTKKAINYINHKLLNKCKYLQGK